MISSRGFISKPDSVMSNGCAVFEWFVPRIFLTKILRLGGTKYNETTQSTINSSTPKALKSVLPPFVSETRIVVQPSSFKESAKE